MSAPATDVRFPLERDEAVILLGHAFGPGDLAAKVSEVMWRDGRFVGMGMQEADEVVQWMVRLLCGEEVCT